MNFLLTNLASFSNSEICYSKYYTESSCRLSLLARWVWIFFISGRLLIQQISVTTSWMFWWKKSFSLTVNVAHAMFHLHLFKQNLNKIEQNCWSVEQNCQSIKVHSWQNWCCGRRKMITMNETEYLNTCEYEPHYMKMVHTLVPRSNFSLTSPINIQLS